MKKFTFTFLVLMFAFSSFGFKGCKETDPNYKSNDPYVQTKDKNRLKTAQERVDALFRSNPNSVSTPMGATVWREDGVTVEVNELKAIDEGIAKTISKGNCAGYVNFLKNHSDYTVAVLKSELTPGNNYAFKAPGAQNTGGAFDQGGFSYAMGQVAYKNDSVVGGRTVFAIADQPDAPERNEATANSSENEVEHLVLADGDFDKFKATENHQTGGHPLMAACQ